MQRKEMIEIMKEVDRNISSTVSLDHYFDQLLQAIESAGMLPPRNNKDNRACKCMFGGLGSMSNYTWEKEEYE